MNIKYYFIVIVSLLIIFNSSNRLIAQQKEELKFDYKAIYEITYLQDTNDMQSQRSLYAELLLGKQNSLFRSTQRAYKDSVLMEYVKNKVLTLSAPVVSFVGEIDAFNYQIVKDQSSQVRVYDDYPGGSNKDIAYYSEPMDMMSDWELKSDTKTISGHICQRADISFAGRKWIAWFSLEEITYADGPYKFHGLPGLIFHVYDDKKTWDFSLKEYVKQDTLLSINFREGLNFIKMTKHQLYKSRKELQRNIIDIKEANGQNFGSERKNLLSKLEQYIKTDNNWIERYP